MHETGNWHLDGKSHEERRHDITKTALRRFKMLVEIMHYHYRYSPAVTLRLKPQPHPPMKMPTPRKARWGYCIVGKGVSSRRPPPNKSGFLPQKRIPSLCNAMPGIATRRREKWGIESSDARCRSEEDSCRVVEGCCGIESRGGNARSKRGRGVRRRLGRREKVGNGVREERGRRRKVAIQRKASRRLKRPQVVLMWLGFSPHLSILCCAFVCGGRRRGCRSGSRR